MATSKNSRRERAQELLSQQKRADKRQGMIIVGVCVGVAVLIIGLAAFRPIKDWWDLRDLKGKDIDQIGAPASVCSPLITKAASGNQEHVDPGTKIDYPEAPPAFGKHEVYPDDMVRKLYTKTDRPNIEQLVHNSEHGYTILWFKDIDRGSDEWDNLKAIATKLKGTSNLRLKFKAVEWTDDDPKWSDDGKAWKTPDGKDVDTDKMHVALTHWSKGGEDADISDTSKQVGVWQFCSEVSGAALQDFMLKYPYLDSPEPNGG
ncbi:DUF3105 domain-containing protein [Nocardioides daejeonensis]|uniref:DUF3105 domain-containing protein n=1 Tax=Nocardioides daejeonensis TaxID=1046556 RepID=UPI001EF63ED6|nr:DUF3105 domain-containing protein [Nocardioides daejeonensis]